MNGTAIRRHANGYQRKDEAIRACRRFAAIGVELSSFCGWEFPPYFSRLALVRSYLDQGRLDEAQAEITILRGIIDGVAADEVAFSRPAAAQLASLQGTLSLKGGDATAAAGHFQRAIDILTPRQHPQSPHLASARADLALALAGRGDAAGARALAAQARAAFAQHPAVAPHLRQSLAAVERLLAAR